MSLAEKHPKYDKMIEEIAIHGNVNLACRENDADYRNFILWTRVTPERAQRYAHAKLAGVQAYSDQTIEIADEQPPVIENKNEKGHVIDCKLDAGFVAWQRLRVDTRKWHLAKLLPKQYGDASSIELSGSVSFSALEQRIADGRKRLTDTDAS